MKVIILAFSSVKSICGFSERQIEIMNGSSAGDILNKLFEEYNGLLYMKGRLLFAVNEEYCNESRVLFEGDKLAIFPPVSGG